jgi:hypothetical protein
MLGPPLQAHNINNLFESLFISDATLNELDRQTVCLRQLYDQDILAKHVFLKSMGQDRDYSFMAEILLICLI